MSYDDLFFHFITELLLFPLSKVGLPLCPPALTPYAEEPTWPVMLPELQRLVQSKKLTTRLLFLTQPDTSAGKQLSFLTIKWV